MSFPRSFGKESRQCQRSKSIQFHSFHFFSLRLILDFLWPRSSNKSFKSTKYSTTGYKRPVWSKRRSIETNEKAKTTERKGLYFTLNWIKLSFSRLTSNCFVIKISSLISSVVSLLYLAMNHRKILKFSTFSAEEFVCHYSSIDLPYSQGHVAARRQRLYNSQTTAKWKWISIVDTSKTFDRSDVDYNTTVFIFHR